MVKDTLHKVINCFDSRKHVEVNITVGGLDLKTRRRVVSILKHARIWNTTPANIEFSGGHTLPSNQDPTYNHVDITLYKPEGK